MTIAIPLPLKPGGGSGGGGSPKPPSPSHSSSGGSSHASSAPRPSAAPSPPSSGGNTHIIINNHVGVPSPGYRPPGYYPRPRFGGLNPYWHPPMIYHPWYRPVFFWTPSHYVGGDVSVLQWICTILAVAAIIALIVWAVRSTRSGRRW